MSKNQQKFYVVWVGREPGIYKTWSEALKQVEKYPGAKFKSFLSEQEASNAFAKSPNQELFHNSKTGIKEKKIYTEFLFSYKKYNYFLMIKITFLKVQNDTFIRVRRSNDKI